MCPEDLEYPDIVETYLREHNVLNLCTHGQDGPWTAAVFFAHSGGRFYFMSNPDTLHGSHIGDGCPAAASVHDDVADWRDIKGLQMRGRVWPVTDARQRLSGLRTYFRKYAFAEAFFHGDVPPRMLEKMKGIQLYCFAPELVYWLDNDRGFGNRRQLFPPVPSHARPRSEMK